MSLLFYYPNRPMLVPPDPKDPMNPKSDYIDSLEASGKFIAEYKWNGDNTLIYTDDMSFWNRDKRILHYTPSPEVLKELKQFPKGCILNAETIHRHTKQYKHTIIIHCVMAWKGQLLQGKTWGDSRQILEDTGLPKTCDTQLSYDHHVLIADCIPPAKRNFWRMFQEACKCDDSIEGIVLKKPSGEFKFSMTPVNDVSWMLKIRKPSKKYSF